MPLLKTRLIPPRRERGVVDRDIVPDLVERMGGARVVIVRAPAGYGKSLLLGQLHDRLAEAGEATGWISAADLGNSVREFSLYLVSSVMAALGAHGSSEIEWLFSGLDDSDLPTIAMAVCNAMHRLDRRLTLFLDDLHALDGTDSMPLFGHLVRDSPALVRFVVATRSQPCLNLSRLRAHGALLEVGPEELRFSIGETVRFLGGGAPTRPLTSDWARQAHARTEGWPAGLQMLVLTNAADDPADPAAHFTGADRKVRDYLDDDVLARQSAEVRAFATQSAVLREFSAELCDELLERRDSRSLIAQVEAAGLFIFSLDATGDWFRYHHLFREFLQRQLADCDPTAQKRLHARAACCLRTRGQAGEALYHACAAGDLPLAAAVLDDCCEESFYQGRLWSLADWIRRVPEDLLDAYPRMQLARVWSLTLELRFDEADQILRRVTRHIAAGIADGSLASEAARDLDRLVLHRQMMLAQFRDDLTETERLCNKLLLDFPNDDEPFLRGSLDASLANANRELYKLDSMDRLDRSARDFFGRTGMSYPLVFHESIVGSSCLQRGRAEQSARSYKSAIDIATSIAGDSSALTAMPALLLAQLELERCEFAACRARFDRYLPLAGGIGFVDQLIAGYVGRARLAAVEEDFGLAEELLTRGEEVAAAGSFDRLRWQVTAERVRQRLRRHDVRGAQHIATKIGLSRDAEVFRPGDGVTSRTEAMALTWIRLRLTEGDHRAAEDLARRWEDFAKRRDAVRTELRMRCVRLACRLSAGDHSAATRQLIEAVERASRCGYALPFFEEGDALRALVARWLEADPDASTRDIATSLAVRLSRGGDTAFDVGNPAEPPPAAATATLSAREVDIVNLIATGAHNKEVGARLGLTEGTVKWYLQQIYRKLGTRRRLEAVSLARSNKLIR